MLNAASASGKTICAQPVRTAQYRHTAGPQTLSKLSLQLSPRLYLLFGALNLIADALESAVKGGREVPRQVSAEELQGKFTALRRTRSDYPFGDIRRGHGGQEG